jgi:hypothetical protein
MLAMQSGLRVLNVFTDMIQREINRGGFQFVRHIGQGLCGCLRLAAARRWLINTRPDAVAACSISGLAQPLFSVYFFQTADLGGAWIRPHSW